MSLAALFASLDPLAVSGGAGTVGSGVPGFAVTSSPVVGASALEGIGILLYAGLVIVVTRVAARWAERALGADAPPGADVESGRPGS